MTYFKLHIRLLIADVLVFILYIIVYLLIFENYSEITAAFPTFLFATVFLVDGVLLFLFKADLLSETYKGTVSCIFFKGRLIVDLCVGCSLMIAGIVLTCKYGIVIA